MNHAYLLAYPAGHSLSPVLHNAAFGQLGLNAWYEALEVSPKGLPDAVARLRNRGTLGANVTIPHKQAVMPLLDRLSEAAQAIGAVNTIVNERGTLTGHNTDTSGFLRALLEADIQPRGKRALLLGAGGAARAVVYALFHQGVAELYVYNRTFEKGVALAESFAELGRAEVLEWEALPERVRGTDLLVNTTSVGMARGGRDPGVSPLPERVLPYGGVVVDLVYRPARTKLLKDAEAAGLKTQNGLPMLVYQGAEAFRLWTGQDAPTETMREAAEEALRDQPN